MRISEASLASLTLFQFINGWDNNVLTDAIANCLVQNDSGVVEQCSSFSPSNDPDSPTHCPERSPVYPCEKVHGLLPNLPGCAASGSKVTCPGGVQPTCSPNFNTYGLSASAGNDQYSLIGCYTEATSGRALTAKSYSDSSNMTVESCLEYCSGYQYSGVEYGQEVSFSMGSLRMLPAKLPSKSVTVEIPSQLALPTLP